jgi:hypothetical protein
LRDGPNVLAWFAEALDAAGLLLLPSSPDGRITLKRYLVERAGALVGDTRSDISQLLATAPSSSAMRGRSRSLSWSASSPPARARATLCSILLWVGRPDAAQVRDRLWIGIDVTHWAVGLIQPAALGSTMAGDRQDGLRSLASRRSTTTGLSYPNSSGEIRPPRSRCPQLGLNEVNVPE